MLSGIFHTQLSFLQLEKTEISESEALDTMRACYRVYLENQKSQFKWESMAAMSAIKKEIMDVVIRNT